MRHIDLLIYGATGFTGNYVVEALAKWLATSKRPLRWAVAGRNRSKLQTYLNNVSTTTGVELRHIECLEADVHNSKGLDDIFRRCRLVMNCTGPYSLLGVPVVESCVSVGTNYMDLSGEPLFMERLMQRFHRRAIEQNISVVSSCGIDSIPADLGTAFLKANFDGTLNQVEHYLQLWSKEEHFSYATWLALIEGYKGRKKLKQVRRDIFQQFYKPFTFDVPLGRRLYTKNNFGHCVPFPGSDRSVVARSQRERYTRLGELPTQFEAYFCSDQPTALLKLAFLATSIQLLSGSKLGEQLLNRYSAFFSAGLFDKNVGPKRENLMGNRFRITQVGKGWSSGQQHGPYDRCSAVQIDGGDAAYLDTSVIAVHTALLLLDKIAADTVPKGVLTPASAIEPDELLPSLNRNNVTFQFIPEYKI